MAPIECVPNASEGRRRDVVDAIADAIKPEIRSLQRIHP
jgi:glutamate formiminotransferase